MKSGRQRPRRERRAKNTTSYGDFFNEREMDEAISSSSRPKTRSSSRRSVILLNDDQQSSEYGFCASKQRKRVSSFVVAGLEDTIPIVGEIQICEIQDSGLSADCKDWNLACSRRKPFPTPASSRKRPAENSSSDSPSEPPQQGEKKKRKRNVPKLIKEYTRLPVDESGEVILPITLKGLKILCLGKVNHANPNFHAKRYIWPVGFKSERPYYSMDHPDVRCLYTNEIVEHNGDVRFIVTSDEDPDTPIIHATPSGAWAEIGKRVSALKEGILGRRINTQLSGPEMFGFSYPAIAKLIQDMPGAELCTKYERQQFVRATSDIIRDKKSEPQNEMSADSSQPPKSDDELSELLSTNEGAIALKPKPDLTKRMKFIPIRRHAEVQSEKLVIRMGRINEKDEDLQVKEKVTPKKATPPPPTPSPPAPTPSPVVPTPGANLPLPLVVHPPPPDEYFGNEKLFWVEMDDAEIFWPVFLLPLEFVAVLSRQIPRPPGFLEHEIILVCPVGFPETNSFWVPTQRLRPFTEDLRNRGQFLVDQGKQEVLLEAMKIYNLGH